MVDVASGGKLIMSDTTRKEWSVSALRIASGDKTQQTCERLSWAALLVYIIYMVVLYHW